MYILGLYGSLNLVEQELFGLGPLAFHDASAALVNDGEIVVACEEERLNRIKHSNKFPVLSIRFCLEKAGLSLSEIDFIVFAFSEKAGDAMLNRYYKTKNVKSEWRYPILTYLQNLLKQEFNVCCPVEKFRFLDHHFAHAASAYYSSPFDHSLVLTLDGFGEVSSGCIYLAQGNAMAEIKAYGMQQSLGNLYNRITMDVLNFSQFSEYKVMGLAPYGNPATYESIFKKHYALLPGGDYEIQQDKIIRKLNAIASGDPFSQTSKDIAAALQSALETIVFHILSNFQGMGGSSNLSYAGGVALNATLNGKIAMSGLFKNISIFPAANDSGISAGLALGYYYKTNPDASRKAFDNVYTGPHFNEGENWDTREVITQWQPLVAVQRDANIAKTAAKLLADGKVIGWVQGQSEYGPRALGNRSILADPRPAENKDRINKMIKKREGFRPFAPSVLEPFVKTFFEVPDFTTCFPHMIYVFNVLPQFRSLLGAVTHVDGTARIQTVSRDTNERYFELIDCFRELTGLPILLNTSFNNNHEPIVNNIQEAISTFLTTDLDYLVIEDYLICKDKPLHEGICDFSVSLPKGYRTSTRKPASLFRLKKRPPSYVIENSFDDKVHPISPELFALLRKDEGPPRQMKNSLALTQEIIERWSERVLTVSPHKAIHELKKVHPV